MTAAAEKTPSIVDVLEKARIASIDDAKNPDRKMGVRPVTTFAPDAEIEPAPAPAPVVANVATLFEANAIQDIEVKLEINRRLAEAIEATISEHQAQLSGVRRVISAHEAFLNAHGKALG